MTTKDMIPKKDAVKEVQIAITRLALMHLAYARTLVNEFGDEKGKELIIKSIFEYGEMIGNRIKQGKTNLPSFGVHSGEIKTLKDDRVQVSGCQLAKIFKESDELELGALYCFVDPAKSMTVDPTKKLIHTSCEACGDENCTFTVVSTTKKEQQIFEKKTEELKELDKYLMQDTASE